RGNTRPRPTKDRSPLYEEITNKIIAELEAGRLPLGAALGLSLVRRLEANRGIGNTFEISSDGSQLIQGSVYGEISIRDTSTSKRIGSIPNEVAQPRDVVIPAHEWMDSCCAAAIPSSLEACFCFSD